MTAIGETLRMTATLLNFRDLGGLSTADGRQVRNGLLYRSDDIGALATADWHAMQADLGLVAAIDMRSGFEDEMAAGAQTVDGGVVVHRIPILDGSMMHAAESGELDLGQMYRHIVEESGKALAEGVNAVADAMPALVFCTAGKDRTGLLVAIVLEAIGVQRSEVVADYVRSGDATPALRARMYERFGDRAPQVPDELFTAPRPVIEATLDAVVDDHGSAARYLIEHGADAGALGRLEAQLLG